MPQQNIFEINETFSPGDLIKLTGITREIYNQWLFRGIFKATFESDGPGTSSKFTLEDLLTVYVVNLLRRYDVRLKTASKIAESVISELKIWMGNNEFLDNFPILYVTYGGQNSIKVHYNDILTDLAIRLNFDMITSAIKGNDTCFKTDL